MRTSPFIIPVTVYTARSGDKNASDVLLGWLHDRAQHGVRDFTLHEAAAGLHAAGVTPSPGAPYRIVTQRMMNRTLPDGRGRDWTAEPTPVVARTSRGRYKFIGTISDEAAHRLDPSGADLSRLSAAIVAELAAFQTPGNRTFTSEYLLDRLTERGHVVTEDSVWDELSDLHASGAIHLSILRDGRYRLVPKSDRKPRPRGPL